MSDDFGSQLRRARVRKGLDVNTVARRLRIRPDIIQAIEDSDFERMPPRGYARNMINSYAQLLGLNASEMTGLYLDQQYAYQVNAARKKSRGTGFDIPSSRSQASGRIEGANRHGRASSDHYEISGYERGDLTRTRNARTRERRYDDSRSTGGRRLYDDYDSGRVMSRSEAERTYRRGGGSHRSQARALGEDAAFNVVASPAPARGLGSRGSGVNWPLVGIVAVAAILLVILLVLLFGPKDSSNEVTSMPVSTDSSAGSSSASAVAATAPTSFTFSYNVNSGTTTWIEVYIDGERQMADNVEGPSTKTFTTSGVLEFICSDPTGVKATQDGKDIALTTNDEGVVDLKIDFNDILAEWQAQHGSASSASGSGSAASSSSSASSSATSLRGIDAEARAAASSSASGDSGDGDNSDGTDDSGEDYYDEGETDDSADYYEE